MGIDIPLVPLIHVQKKDEKPLLMPSPHNDFGSPIV